MGLKQSKIIQKEKERQEEILKVINSKKKIEEITVGRFSAMMNKKFCHKQSLINLKEYMEGELIFNQSLWESSDSMKTGVTGCDAIPTWRGMYNRLKNKVSHLKEDIQELTKMIERYE